MFPIEWNWMKLTGYIKGAMHNIPTKFEGILKKLKFYEILSILTNFYLRTVIYTFMVLKYMIFTRKTSLVYNRNGLVKIKIYSTYFHFHLLLYKFHV